MMEADNTQDQNYKLQLFISGASPNSLKAIHNLKRILEKYLRSKYTLEVVDIYQETGVAEKEQIIAVPMLLKKVPLPQRRLIGDMSDTKKVLEGLGLNCYEREQGDETK